MLNYKNICIRSIVLDVRQLLGERILRIRHELGLSQEELAFRCGMQPSHIGFIERGQRNPTLDTLERVALGLGVSVSDLLNFDAGPQILSYDVTTNKILSFVLPLGDKEKKQLLTIVRAFARKSR